MNENIFELATRYALRFPTNRGEVTTEQLWDMSLTSKNGFDLDTVAKAINRDLVASNEESFVTVTKSAKQDLLELQLDVVKHIIAIKISEGKAAHDKAKRKAERDRLLQILSQKEDQALIEMSAEDIRKRIEELS